MLLINRIGIEKTLRSTFLKNDFGRRTIFLEAVTSLLGTIIFNENNRLASKMDNGELHYKNANVILNNAQKDKYKFKRPEPKYPGHVPLYTYERIIMMVGSSLGAYFHPERNEFIVALGESTALPCVLEQMRDQMLSDPVGRQILRERPRMTSASLNLDYLRQLPDNTIGRNYVKWLDREKVSPDTRVPVRFINDDELAYVFQRYRECHDFYHTITGLPIIIEGEIAVKLLEFMNIGIPMSGLGALFAPLRLKPSQKERLYNIYYPWGFRSGLNSKPLLNVYWEKILEEDIDEFREKIGIEQPPDLRNMRKKYFEELKKKKKLM